MLDGHRIGIRVKIGLGLPLGDPAAIDLVCNRQLSRLVVELDDDFLAEVVQGYFRTKSRSEVPYFIGPLFKLGIVGYAALQRDGVIFSPTGRLSAAAGIAAFAMLDHLRRALQHAHLADSGDIAAIPLHAEFEVFVGIEPRWIHTELSHAGLLMRLSVQPSAESE